MSLDNVATTRRWATVLDALSRTTGNTAWRDPDDDECVIVRRGGAWVRFRLNATALRFVYGEFGEQPGDVPPLGCVSPGRKGDDA